MPTLDNHASSLYTDITWAGVVSASTEQEARRRVIAGMVNSEPLYKEIFWRELNANPR